MGKAFSGVTKEKLRQIGHKAKEQAAARAKAGKPSAKKSAKKK